MVREIGEVPELKERPGVTEVVPTAVTSIADETAE